MKIHEGVSGSPVCGAYFKGSTERRNVEPVLHDLLNCTLLIHDASEKFAFFRWVFLSAHLTPFPLIRLIPIPSRRPYALLRLSLLGSDQQPPNSMYIVRLARNAAHSRRIHRPSVLVGSSWPSTAAKGLLFVAGLASELLARSNKQ